MCVCVCVYACMLACCMHAYMCVCVCVCMYICMYVCMYVCMYSGVEGCLPARRILCISLSRILGLGWIELGQFEADPRGLGCCVASGGDSAAAHVWIVDGGPWLSVWGGICPLVWRGAGLHRGRSVSHRSVQGSVCVVAGGLGSGLERLVTFVPTLRLRLAWGALCRLWAWGRRRCERLLGIQ